jgi:hypothetical protein
VRETRWLRHAIGTVRCGGHGTDHGADQAVSCRADGRQGSEPRWSSAYVSSANSGNFHAHEPGRDRGPVDALAHHWTQADI